MEGFSKFYSASIIINEMTLSHIDDLNKYGHRFLGKVQEKGKKDIVSVCEAYDGDPEESKQLKMETKADLEKGLSLYFKKLFTDAAVIFKKVVDLNPNDRAARL